METHKQPYRPAQIEELGAIQSLTLGSVNGDTTDNVQITIGGFTVFGTMSPTPTP